MASGPEIRMESSKVNLITQLLSSSASALTAAISLLKEATTISPSLEAQIKHATRGKRPRSATMKTNGKADEDHNDGGGNVVPIGPLLRAPIDPQKEYDLNFVAKYLGKSGQTIRKHINTGSLNAEKRGNGRGAWFIKGEELIKFNNSTIGDDT